MRITHVFETHIHNDYVTGGLALAQEVGAAYHVNADDPVDFERTGVSDGDVLEVGDTMRVRVVHTPGHTHTHLSYALEAEGRPVAVFTGGSLLFGSTGRPDLLGPDHTDTLVRAQWHSAHRLAEEPEETEVFHGFGSFCSATQSEAVSSTIGQEKTSNPALTQGEQEYVDALLAGLDEFPAYYAHMGPANSAGPGAPDLSAPELADPAELRRRIDAGEWVVDLRTRSAFAAGHLTGSLNFGLDGQFITYLGWLIRGTPPSRCSARHPRTSPRRSGTWPGSASSARRRWPPASPRTGPRRRAGVVPGRHVRGPRGRAARRPRSVRSCSTCAAARSSPSRTSSTR